MEELNNKLDSSNYTEKDGLFASERAHKNMMESLRKKIRLYDRIKYLPLPLLLPLSYKMVDLLDKYREYAAKSPKVNVEFQNGYELALSIVMLIDIAITHHLCVKSTVLKDRYALKKRKNLLSRTKTALQADREEAHSYEMQDDLRVIIAYINDCPTTDISREKELNKIIEEATEVHFKLPGDEPSEVKEYICRSHQ